MADRYYNENEEGDEHIATFPIILALTRPPTILGVPYLYVCVEGFAAMMIYLVMGSILWLPASLAVFHAILYVLCVKGDLWFFDILFKQSACGINPVGRKIGGGVRTYGG
jgi:type IV secretion system protein VirB3